MGSWNSVTDPVGRGVEMDGRSATEAKRAAKRPDNRAKDWSVPVKRIELARSWLENLLEEADRWEELLEEMEAHFMVMADACPLGLGAICAFEPVAALKVKVTQEDADFLGVQFSQAASYGGNLGGQNSWIRRPHEGGLSGGLGGGAQADGKFTGFELHGRRLVSRRRRRLACDAPPGGHPQR